MIVYAIADTRLGYTRYVRNNYTYVDTIELALFFREKSEARQQVVHECERVVEVEITVKEDGV